MSNRRPRPQRIRLTIEDLAHDGQGMAHHESTSQLVLVAGTLPSEEVEVEVSDGHRQTHAKLIQIVSPSLERVTPPCQHHARCGGCDWMHATAQAQEGFHVRHVTRTLSKTGIEVPEVRFHKAESALGYRTRARLSIEANRGGVRIGYRPTRSNRLVAIDSCPVLSTQLACLPGLLAELLSGSDGHGEARCALGQDGLPVMAIQWSGQVPPTTFGKAERLVTAGTIAGVSILLEGARTPATIGDTRIIYRSADGMPMTCPAGGFTQASDSMNERLAKRVAELTACDERPTLEMFAGSGNFTVLLARQTSRLQTVELDAAAVDAARANLAQRGLKAKSRAADAEQTEVPTEVEVLVLDPPRTGAPKSVARLARSRVARAVMVSCNPATLARDAEQLQAGGFKLHSIELFDMFPNTSHVETVAVFQRS